jgi:alpha-L-fucosidase 2
VKEVNSSAVKLEVDWEAYMANNDMEWVVKPVSWDEGAFLGNGLLGTMVYGEEHANKRNVLRMVTGRTDVTAVRTDKPGFPPRVQLGELDLELAGKIYHPTKMRINLWNADCRLR